MPTLFEHQSDEATIEVAGLQVRIRGLDCLKTVHQPDLVLVLHGRTQTKDAVEGIATAVLSSNPGTIVVTFDHRNHGHRLLSGKANGTWADGNPNHAQDMFAILYGTSRDVSELISLLPTYLSTEAEFKFRRIFCVGVSLGGHSTYIALSDDPRISAGVVIIGCPDLAYLMRLRAGDQAAARLPSSFMETVHKLGATAPRLSEKQILVLKGNEDPLVPWQASDAFLQTLPKENLTIKGYEGVGHAVTPAMVLDTAAWISELRSRP